MVDLRGAYTNFRGTFFFDAIYLLKRYGNVLAFAGIIADQLHVVVIQVYGPHERRDQFLLILPVVSIPVPEGVEPKFHLVPGHLPPYPN